MTSMISRCFLRIRRKATYRHIKKFCTQTFEVQEDCSEEKCSHIPVMLNEVIENIDLQEGNIFLDMTFGAGGHSSALLERIPNLKVIALDRDPVAIEYAHKLNEKYQNQITPLLGTFSELPMFLTKTGVKINSIDAVLFDLGCSEMQLNEAERGFSMNKDGPLDMRMDGKRNPNQLTAADVLAHASHNELYQMFKIYGNENKALKIATEIVEARQSYKSVKTTKELCDLIQVVLGIEDNRDGLNQNTKHAAKVFQALRIFVNNEVNELNYGLLIAHRYLKPEKKVLAISFNILEDTIVKRHFNNSVVHNSTKPLPLGLLSQVKHFTFDEMFEIDKKLWNPSHKKVITPSKQEISRNPRCQTAKLRVAVKLLEDDHNDESI